MKVVVTTSYPRFDGDGCGAFVAEHARATGCDAVICATREQGQAALSGPTIHRCGGGDFDPPGIEYHRATRSIAAHASVLRFVRAARRKLRELAPTQVVAHFLVPGVVPVVLPRLPTDPQPELLCVAHGADVRWLLRKPRWLRELIYRRIHKSGATVQFVSARGLEATLGSLSGTTRAWLLETATKSPLPLGAMPSPTVVEAYRLAHRTKGRRVVVTVGRLVASKRVDLAAVALAAMTQFEGSPPIEWWVVGDGPERANLQRHARSLCPEVRVTFMGQLPRPETLLRIGAADLLLHTSRDEAAPTVIREARAMGIEVAATDAGDVGLWAQHDKGIHLTRSDPFAIGEVVATILTKPRSIASSAG